MGKTNRTAGYRISCIGEPGKDATFIDRHLSRRLPLLLILALVIGITGCGLNEDASAVLQSGKQDADTYADPTSYQPGGPFLFYRQTDFGRMDYGLVDADGNIVLALEHDSLEALQPYYAAGKFNYAQWLDDWILFYALVSPDGDLLTEYVYVYLGAYDADSFVSIRIEEGTSPVARYAYLDSEGKESPIKDKTVLEEIEHLGRYYETGSWSDGLSDLPDSPALRKGPDLPETGLEWTLELSDGRYWGAYYGDPLTESPYEVSPDEFHPDSRTNKASGNIYDTNMSLFDDTGSLCGLYTYIYVDPLSENLWIGTSWFYHEENDGYTMVYSLITPEGIPLNNQVYDYIWAEPLSSGIVARSEDGVLLLDPATGAERKIICDDAGPSCWLSTSEGKNLLVVDGETQEQTIPRVIDIDTGESTDFTYFPGGTVTELTEGGDRFVIYSPRPFDLDWPKEEANSAFEFATPGISDSGGRYFLVDESGYPLVSYANFISYEKGFFRVVSFTSGEPVYPLSSWGLFDRNGNEILPCFFQELTLLDGYAAYVQKGDSFGIIDFSGNWIYQESVYQTLE